MAVLETVSPGEMTHAAKWNKIINTWNNVLGVTDDAQANLGRLPLPWLPNNPTTVSGLAWMRNNEGANGRLYIRQKKISVAYQPYRQRVRGTPTASPQSVTAASFTDITNLTLSITTTGGRLRILIIPDSVGFTGGSIGSVSNGSTQGYGDLRAVVGAVALAPMIISKAEITPSGTSQYYPCSAFSWYDYQPAAGTYTVKIQARCILGLNITVQAGCTLLVEEYGD